MAQFEIQPGQPDQGVCSARECRQPILWVRTAAGKPMCLDRLDVHVRDDGRLLVDSSTTHWSSCVARQRFIRAKKGARA